MIRYSSLLAILLTSLMFVGAKEARARNVLVDLTDDGTLMIVEEFVGGKNFPFTTVQIVTENDVVSLIPHNGTSLNGLPNILDFGPADIHAIEVTNVDWLIVFAFPQPLMADLTVHGAGEVEIGSIAQFAGIVGTTTISNGLGTGIVTISDVHLIGDLSVSTGHGTDLVQFGAQYGLLNRFGPVDIHGNVSIHTGQDNDYVWIESSLYVGGDVEIQLGQGTDLLLGEDRLTTEPDSNVSIFLGQQ